MTKRQDQARERKLNTLAASESAIHERLLSVRSEIDAIAFAIDKLCVYPRRQLYAGHDLIGNLLTFPHRARGKS